MDMQPVTFTPEGAVSISYPTLVSSPLSLHASIEQAFGSNPKSLGIIVVKDLPPIYAVYRERLLKLGYKFATLDENIREQYADPATKYSFGWSYGKEIMNGKPDTLKGSYYVNINPATERSDVSSAQYQEYPEYYGRNIWPKRDERGVEGFEEAFKDLGSFVFKVGCELAAACQPFVSQHLSNSSISLPDVISTSRTTKARLLHYFPPSEGNILPSDDEPVDSWCGFHLDHSLLTGLCSAMFLRNEGSSEPTIVSSPSPKSGLYIRTRGGDLTRVAIPSNCLAFQTGEALELVTERKLQATPHCVRVGAGEGVEKVSRETFALFMQPDTDQSITPSETFGQFSKRIFAVHYEDKST